MLHTSIPFYREHEINGNIRIHIFSMNNMYIHISIVQPVKIVAELQDINKLIRFYCSTL